MWRPASLTRVGDLLALRCQHRTYECQLHVQRRFVFHCHEYRDGHRAEVFRRPSQSPSEVVRAAAAKPALSACGKVMMPWARRTDALPVSLPASLHTVCRVDHGLVLSVPRAH